MKTSTFKQSLAQSILKMKKAPAIAGAFTIELFAGIIFWQQQEQQLLVQRRRQQL
jgi:hypothetical protein